MWTPRRIFLLFLGTAAFVTAYVVYARVLGSIDGLPELPARFAISVNDLNFEPPAATQSPTNERLQEAFGPGCHEIEQAYKFRIQRQQEGIVIAIGQPVFSSPPTEEVVVAPFSIAFFGKNKPNPQTGEIQEISTFHSDKAILRFTEKIAGVQDLAGNGKAKLIGMTLFADPDAITNDIRKGNIIVTNNQKSSDTSNHLVFRTPGPLYYTAPEAAQNPNTPQIETHAAIEVVDRKNLPRPVRSQTVATVVSQADELRGPGAVANILLRNTLAPPTITAEGMKIFLEKQENQAATKRNSTGYSGVKTIELVEKVQMNLWTAGGIALPGAAPPREKVERAPQRPDPTLAMAALIGAPVDGETFLRRRLADQSLLVIETLGSFRYDFESGTARFDAAPVANPAVANNVVVTRIGFNGTQDNLFCRNLTIEFEGLGKDKPERRPNDPEPGVKIKRLTAAGPHVYVQVESEKLSAQGTELQYTVDSSTGRSTTALRGTPVAAVRERNKLLGGGATAPGEILITSQDSHDAKGESVKKTTLAINGPGRIDMLDASTNDTTLRAAWGTSLTQEKVLVGDQEQDLLKFEGGGEFTDAKGGMSLFADRLHLWLAKMEEQDTKKSKGDGSRATPQRLLALGNVRGISTDLHIGYREQPPVERLTVWFRDIPTPAQAIESAKTVQAPTPAEPRTDGLPPLPPSDPITRSEEPTESKPKEKKKPPIFLSSRLIESWVVRYPLPKSEVKTDDGVGAVKYELERTLCEDRVVVHQEPEDPLKNPRGLDIAGSKLTLNQQDRAGSVMTVTGSPFAQVHFETMSLFGPNVVIDQPDNSVLVDGVGKLIMPSSNSLGGESSDQTMELVVNWTDSMKFYGAKKNAEFLGRVHALQQPLKELPLPKPESAPPPRVVPAGHAAAAKVPDDETTSVREIWCHRMDVTFDRPIYFNNVKKETPKDSKEEGPKLKSALCIPMPDDEAAKFAEAPIRQVIFRDESRSKEGKRLKASQIVASQIGVKNEDKEQTVLAEGPGEVRILQMGSNDWGKRSGAKGPPEKGAPRTGETKEDVMKLTVVSFLKTMVAKETNKVYQEARFENGADVWQFPSEDLNIKFEKHAPPKENVYLSCTDRLIVSSARPKPDAPIEQKMDAIGNGTFRNADYEGIGSRIQYSDDVVMIEGSDKRMAELRERRNSLDNENSQRARRFWYYRNGYVRADESGSGIINTRP